ncbi:hypothetical protein K474DRAFT_1005622 [Panus rudis PR-1116 ss-1]|nr:hypothetical protein K474DRAFT_1005622 [Panus rudis PR-1116 ss-1]
MNNAGRVVTEGQTASNASAMSGNVEGFRTVEIVVTSEGSSSHGRSGSTEEVREQAGPLPIKRGELGYREDLQHAAEAQPRENNSSQINVTLPARHPADTDTPAEPSASASPAPPTSSSQTASGSDSSSTHSAGKRSLISKFLKPNRVPKFKGVSLTTLAIFAFQLLFLGGTIAGWVMVVKKVPSISGGSSGLGFNSTAIFVHVAFTIATLFQIIFLERNFFRIRAERYAHVHPGEILPRSRSPTRNPALALAPWNRPPLPTYAAALAQSGVGTGDVEDNVIAVPPPPAYGNTRGSTLLLSGSISDELRTQRIRERVRELGRPVSRLSSLSGFSDRSSRPVSYRSHDSEWEHRVDANRALRLEETLARLEEGGSRDTRPNASDR